MKNKNIIHGIAELDGRKLEIDLDNLYITFERDHFDLARIPGTKGGNRYFFIRPALLPVYRRQNQPLCRQRQPPDFP